MSGGSSLTGITALWFLSKTHLSCLSTGSRPERLLMGRKESTLANKTADSEIPYKQARLIVRHHISRYSR